MTTGVGTSSWKESLEAELSDKATRSLGVTCYAGLVAVIVRNPDGVRTKHQRIRVIALSPDRALPIDLGFEDSLKSVVDRFKARMVVGFALSILTDPAICAAVRSAAELGGGFKSTYAFVQSLGELEDADD